jgi:hypothetical protein
MKQNNTTQPEAKPTPIQEGGHHLELRYSQRRKYYFIDEKKGGEDYTVFILDGSEDAANKVFSLLNEHDSLKAENEQLREANKELLDIVKDLVGWGKVQGERFIYTTSRLKFEEIKSAIQKHK